MDQLKTLWRRLEQLTQPLFPPQEIYARPIKPWVQLTLFVALAAIFTVGANFYPAGGYIGFDWVKVFDPGLVPPFYPPWTIYIVNALTWPLLIGLSLAAVCLAALKRARHPLSLVAALLSLPVLWTLFLGQLEGLVVLGLLALPWLAPLALLKPQVSLFAFGARRSYLIGAAIFLLLSLLIWGWWPGRMFATNSYYAEGRYPQDISIGLWGAVVALPLFWFSRGDMDMLMVAGAFMTPHLIPYNLMPVAPAIARLRPALAGLTMICSWLSLSANWLGPAGWWLGWLAVIVLWLGLAYDRYVAKRPAAAPVAEAAAARV